MLSTRPVDHALSVHLCRAKSITRSDDRHTEGNFSKSGVWDKVAKGSSHLRLHSTIRLRLLSEMNCALDD